MKYKELRYREFATDARVQSKMSQLQIAKALGISRSSWQKYEYGSRLPKAGHREAIRALLGIPVEPWDEPAGASPRPTQGGLRSA